MPRFALLILIGALAGCASSSIPIAETRPAPPERVFYKSPPNPVATLVVIRDGRSMYGNERREILMDGQLVAEMGNAEHVRLPVAAGEHILGSRSAWGTVTSTAVEVRPNGTYVFRAGNDSNGSVTFMRAMN